MNVDDQWKQHIQQALSQGTHQSPIESSEGRRQLIPSLVHQAALQARRQADDNPITAQDVAASYQRLQDTFAEGERAFLQLEETFLADQQAYIQAMRLYREALQRYRANKQLYEQTCDTYIQILTHYSYTASALSSPELDAIEAACLKAQEAYREALVTFASSDEEYERAWKSFIEIRERYKQSMEAHDGVEISYLETLLVCLDARMGYVQDLESELSLGNARSR